MFDVNRLMLHCGLINHLAIGHTIFVKFVSNLLTSAFFDSKDLLTFWIPFKIEYKNL